MEEGAGKREMRAKLQCPLPHQQALLPAGGPRPGGQPVPAPQWAGTSTTSEGARSFVGRLQQRGWMTGEPSTRPRPGRARAAPGSPGRPPTVGPDLTWKACVLRKLPPQCGLSSGRCGRLVDLPPGHVWASPRGPFQPPLAQGSVWADEKLQRLLGRPAFLPACSPNFNDSVFLSNLKISWILFSRDEIRALPCFMSLKWNNELL